MVTTRTIGPLHLEDLEPHRFEDLVRQLLYDFRPWRSLEATGRAGADKGFDARGTEAAPGLAGDLDDDSEEDALGPRAMGERIWLVQCKREKAIGPQKLVNYLDEISDPASLYGVIFAAACDFSTTARDGFRDKVRELGFEEAHLWGKAEVEDQLFQPKNDHLLFAYFGISLQSRRRTLKSELRARLATKRKALRVLTEHEHRPILLRDATDDRYPWMDKDEKKSAMERRRWTVKTFRGTCHAGLQFELHRYPAYVGGERSEWDFAEKFDTGPVREHENPWSLRVDDLHELRPETFDIWDALAPENKYWLVVIAILPFENILDIDENGDDWFDKPQIYVTEFSVEGQPFSGIIEVLEPERPWGQQFIVDSREVGSGDGEVRLHAGNRVHKFRRAEPQSTVSS